MNRGRRVSFSWLIVHNLSRARARNRLATPFTEVIAILIIHVWEGG